MFSTRTWACALAGLFFSFLCVDVGRADTIEGEYSVQGSMPGETSRYQGEAVIKCTGETYSVAWKVGAQVFIGTGLARDGVFSIVFRDRRSNSPPGIASFRIEGDKVKDGAPGRNSDLPGLDLKHGPRYNIENFPLDAQADFIAKPPCINTGRQTLEFRTATF